MFCMCDEKCLQSEIFEEELCNAQVVEYFVIDVNMQCFECFGGLYKRTTDSRTESMRKTESK